MNVSLLVWGFVGQWEGVFCRWRCCLSLPIYGWRWRYICIFLNFVFNTHKPELVVLMYEHRLWILEKTTLILAMQNMYAFYIQFSLGLLHGSILHIACLFWVGFDICMVPRGNSLLNFSLLHVGRLEDCKDSYRTFYSLMYLIHTCEKPHVSLLYLSPNWDLWIYTRFLEYGHLRKFQALLCWILLSNKCYLKNVIPFRAS